MKAVLSNRIFLEVDPELEHYIKDKLTYKIAGYSDDIPPTIIRNYSYVRPGIMSIPIGRIDLIPPTHQIVEKRVLAPTTFPEFLFDLRASQQEVYDNIEDNAIINASVSWGKTFSGLAIAGKLGQKTLVVTHTVPLRNQWARETKKVYGFEPGIIGSGRFETDTPIVIANTQTLIKKVPQTSRMFGTVILDECLDYNSRITTEDGLVFIGKIVNNKLTPKVLSYNESTGELEWKKILRHFKNTHNEDMIKLKLSNGSSLTCTLNHTIYTLKGKKKAEDILEGEYILAQKTFKSSNILNDTCKPILLGMILGDGCLRNNGKSVRVSITNGEKQEEYLNYKKSVLDIFQTKNVVSKSGYKPENSISTITSASFYDIDNWKSKLYLNNSSKNNITKDLADLLNPISWSFIYQDDGSISRNKYVTFSFCEMNDSSIELLKNSLQKIFEVSPITFKCSRGFSYIRLNRECSEKFITKIAKYIHPSMAYKKGEYAKDIVFEPVKVTECFDSLTAVKVEDIDFVYPTSGYRYNIEVEDNHNYFANNKLVANCHHVSSPTVSDIINKSFARYKLGLSGTIQRKDGKHVVFRDFFGNNVIQPPEENKLTPVVHIYKTKISLPGTGATPWAIRVNNLVSNPEYMHLIAMLAAKYSVQGHNVLALSDRVEFLENISKLIGPNAVAVTGKVKEEREALIEQVGTTYNVLCGTQSIFSEGISHTPLSCLVLGAPVNNEPLLEQLIGRVVRLAAGKQTPVIVDVNLSGHTGEKQAQARLGHYIRKGYKMETIWI